MNRTQPLSVTVPSITISNRRITNRSQASTSQLCHCATVRLWLCAAVALSTLQSITGIIASTSFSGFIKLNEGGEDVFVHQSEIQSEGYRTIHDGEKVKFLVVEKNNRHQAVNATSCQNLDDADSAIGLRELF
ncbi:hypothetical protein L6452_00313 [Arctium lappa]|uniref:Uncharacterized protein n=1 Tax=Arctium lappa TaxID=4217 RepID=A0ACB9FE70_ARCLA|nr:hypothetical protein L6452_00313 [Arctium lappa]